MSQSQVNRSVNPEHLNINPATIAIIKNTLLRYQFNSQYYLNIPNKDHLYIILFLCLYDNKHMKPSKKIASLFHLIEQPYLKEMNTYYFNMHGQNLEELSIPSLFQTLSSQFAHHYKLIQDNASKVQATHINAIFEHEAFKNRVRIREYKNDTLIPYAHLPFKQAQYKTKNDIIIISYETGYYLVCYSSRDQEQIRGSRIYDKKERESEKKEQLHQEEVEKQQQKIADSKEEMEIEAKMKPNNEEEQDSDSEEQQLLTESQQNEKLQLKTCFAFLVILIFLISEVYHVF